MANVEQVKQEIHWNRYSGINIVPTLDNENEMVEICERSIATSITLYGYLKHGGSHPIYNVKGAGEESISAAVSLGEELCRLNALVEGLSVCIEEEFDFDEEDC